MRKTREFWKCRNTLTFPSLSTFRETQPQQEINKTRGAQRQTCKPTPSPGRKRRGPSCTSQTTSSFLKENLRERVLLFPLLLLLAALWQRLSGSCPPFPGCRQPFSPRLRLCSPATSAPRPDAAWEHPQALHGGHSKPIHYGQAPGPHHTPLAAKLVPHAPSWCKMCSWCPLEHRLYGTSGS